MGNESNVKQIRGQVRQIVKEVFPDLAKNELYADLQRVNKERLDQIAKSFDELVKSVNERIEATLKEVNDRSKDVQDFVLRQSVTPTLSLKDEK